MLSWQEPLSPPGQDILNYTITYVGRDGGLVSITVPPEQRSLVISNLKAGPYTFNISAVYQEGRGPSVSVMLMVEGVGQVAVVEQPWFYAVVAVAGTVLLLILLILVICICYQLCKWKGES